MKCRCYVFTQQRMANVSPFNQKVRQVFCLKIVAAQTLERGFIDLPEMPIIRISIAFIGSLSLANIHNDKQWKLFEM